MTRSLLTIVVLLLTAGAARGESDPFRAIKADMAAAGCCRYEFLSILESDVFETIDTTLGTALISADGRYHIVLGQDEYLKTSDRFYSYSRVENQLTVENIDSDLQPQQSVSFLTRLDDYYLTETRAQGRRYFLRRTDSAAVNLPDSMTVFLAEKPPRLDRLVFLDVNEDRNSIVFTMCENVERCDESALSAHFPDSAQVIHIQ